MKSLMLELQRVVWSYQAMMQQIEALNDSGCLSPFLQGPVTVTLMRDLQLTNGRKDGECHRVPWS